MANNINGPKKEMVSARFSSEEYRYILAYCSSNNYSTVSEFARDCMLKAIAAPIKDKNIVLTTLDGLTRRIGALDSKSEHIIYLLFHFFQTFFTYTPTIPKELQDTAIKSGETRFKGFMNGYQEFRKENPRLFSVLLADMIDLALLEENTND